MYPSILNRRPADGTLVRSMRLLLVTALAFLVVSAQPAQAQSGQAWQIDYFPNTEWDGAPVYTAYADIVAFNWRNAAPGPRMPTGNWTARMTSKTFFYAGLYRLTLIADDEFVLRVDGMAYFDTRAQGQSGKAIVLDLPITQGVHTVQLEYRQLTGQGYISLDWHFVKGGLQVPPGTVGAETPATRYGDYRRCITQGLHQSACFAADGTWGAPTLGMIRMEPPIVVWEACAADAVQTRQLIPNGVVQAAQCSKSEAGWFAK